MKPPSKDLLKLIPLLEKLSLIKTDEAMISRLQEAIKVADTIREVNVDGVKPLITLNEKYNLNLREDEVKMVTNREEMLKNSSKIVEGYYVSPPGNDPIKHREAEEDDLVVNHGNSKGKKSKNKK